MRFKIEVTLSDWEALCAWARTERRNPCDHAAYLLTQAVKRQTKRTARPIREQTPVNSDAAA